jgi:hypothetical protein
MRLDFIAQIFEKILKIEISPKSIQWELRRTDGQMEGHRDGE